ncbi:NAD-dependent epimerase/dehydratase family protein [Neptunicella marina]|uniref:NAD(P)-dependent oxidoreductase n=1 Tax=Neptunicella marina TaxID=2125989 RepID=A0A8J6IRQ8_9ALTE|nr:NAD(P)-dependent oxidoreductase [Neptunicella marina]MBC3765571.1 NAD(P)-dependent oxidoreductase [Neptunicella marina]
MNSMARYKNKRVLVTGASGFIGEHLCRYLVEQGAQVIGVYRTNMIDIAGVKGVRTDLTNESQVHNLVEEVKPEFVFHLASEVHGKRDVQYVTSTLHNNLVATVNLLTALELAGGCQRIILAQSQEEISSSGETNGSQPVIPCSPYAASKVAATAYGNMFYQLYQLPVVMARIFMVYGPGQKDLSKLVPYSILCLLKGKSPLISSGTRLVDWIYVEDVVTGLLTMGLQHGIEGKTLDLGSGESQSIRGVIEQLIAVADTEITAEFGAGAGRKHEVEPVADIKHTAQWLHWQPQTTLSQGLANTVGFYRQQLSGGYGNE